VARLFQICGHGVASDMVLTGRPMDATEAYAHLIVSRVVPSDALDATAREMAEKIAAAPYVTVRMARRVIRHLAAPQVRASMAKELITQTFVNGSGDYAGFRAARADGRAPSTPGARARSRPGRLSRSGQSASSSCPPGAGQAAASPGCGARKPGRAR
jgi:enoyl-CoA hydratase/carnithine racemase